MKIKLKLEANLDSAEFFEFFTDLTVTTKRLFKHICVTKTEHRKNMRSFLGVCISFERYLESESVQLRDRSNLNRELILKHYISELNQPYFFEKDYLFLQQNCNSFDSYFSLVPSFNKEDALLLEMKDLNRSYSYDYSPNSEFAVSEDGKYEYEYNYIYVYDYGREKQRNV